MEILKDYDITILYHPGKANVVADALSRKAGSMGSLAHLQASRRPLAREVQTQANDLMRLEVNERGGLLAFVEARSSFLDKIKEDSLMMRNCAEFKIKYCEERLRMHKSMRKVF